MGSGRYTSQGRVLLWEWVLYQGRPVHHTSTMPLMLELKYEYFIADWPGRIKLTELVLGLLSMMCAAPAWDGVQHWFLLVVVVAFLGTIFFSLYYLCLAEPLNKLQVNWLMGEFWFTAATTFFYFTAFVAMLATYCEMDGGDHQYWVDANCCRGAGIAKRHYLRPWSLPHLCGLEERTCGSGCTSCCPATCIGCDVSECLKMIVPLVSLPVSTRVSASHTTHRHKTLNHRLPSISVLIQSQHTHINMKPTQPFPSLTDRKKPLFIPVQSWLLIKELCGIKQSGKPIHTTFLCVVRFSNFFISYGV